MIPHAACYDRIAARDSEIRAWAFVDPHAASSQPGPLHSLAIGIKDVIDVAGMPTGHGSPICAGTIAVEDAECVRRLRAAGAIVIGKTVTAEFATYSPGPTVNPRRPGHTPGGSSSGSAAAVADGQVPVALGTQTAGSIVRPASFCGTLGFKPSFDRYPLAGVLETAPSLDTLGLFAQRLADILAVDAVLAEDAAVPRANPDPIIGLCRTPSWGEADAQMQAAFTGFAQTLAHAGLTVIDRPLPAAFASLGAAQALVHAHEASRAIGHYRRDHPERVSAAFRDFIDAGAAVTPAAYRAALAEIADGRARLPGIFAGIDLLLTPGAPGTAPAGLGATGNPVFQRMWTALGVPCLGFPARWTANGLPLGLQLVGRPGQDRAFLAAAAAVIAHAVWGPPS